MTTPRPDPDEGARPSILVGTGNAHKLEEIAELLAASPYTVVGTSILDPAADALEPPIEETGDTFEANARIKALGFAARALHLEAERRPTWVIADDSGLCVDALDGAPGVRSARYGGEAATDEANNAKLLAALAGVPAEKRTAAFVCAIAAVRLDVAHEGAIGDGTDGAPEVAFVVEERCEGRIVETLTGAGGFGYDPLFFVAELGKTFAEVPRAVKSARSHRGKALAALEKRLHEL